MDRKEQIQMLEKLASDMTSGAKSIRNQIEELREEAEMEAIYDGLKQFVEGEDSLWGAFHMGVKAG